MKHSDQGITRTQRGEEQPADKDRAQLAHQTRDAKSPSRQETSKEERSVPARFGHSKSG
jgi:hypothetical protein